MIRSIRTINCTLACTAAFPLVLAKFCPSAQASELFSESVYVPPQTDLTPVVFDSADLTQVWKRFHILLSGSPNLPTQDATDTNTDPFAVNGTSTITVTNPYVFPANAAGDWVGPGPITVGGLTAVNFTGSVAINASNIPNQNLDNPPGQVQFGLVGPVDNATMNFVGQHWGYEPVAAAPFLRAVPIVDIIPSIQAPASPPQGESFQYIVDFVQFTQDGIAGTEWAEFPYVPGQQPTFSYGGWADPTPFDHIHFTDSAIQLSPTEIPLDELNFANDPLGGSTAGPAFTQEALPADIVPEPATAGLLLIASAAALASRRRRRSLQS
jgi:hypothetical protein